MRPRTIVVTGMGAVSAAGTGCAATLDGFDGARRAAGLVTLFETPIQTSVFEVRDKLPGHPRTDMRTLRLAFAAAGEALEKAQWAEDPREACVGVCLGTTIACQLNDLPFYREFRTAGSASPEAVERYLSGNPAAAVARKYGFRGPTLTIANACSSGSDAIGMGMSWLRAGLCDAVLAGGADELNRVPLAGFHSLGIMSNTPCTPFDRNRQGLNLGEGAGMLFLETAARAARRGVAHQVTCEGYGTFGDAYHLTAPRKDGAGLAKAIRYALEDAQLPPGRVAFINAHGTATPANDAVEGAVLARIFGRSCTLSATKGYTGHTLGAAGALEAVFTALGLVEGWIPGSVGFVRPDPSIPVAPVRHKTEVTGRYALSTSLAFGGNNSALVLGCYA